MESFLGDLSKLYAGVKVGKNVRLLTEEGLKHLNDNLMSVAVDTSVFKRKYINVPYGGERGQAMNIYLPEAGGGPFPAILFLHGGGWMSGSHADTQVNAFLPGLVRGYAVVSIGYRMLPEVHFPDILFDVKKALRFCRAEGHRYMLDTDRLAVAGASAGAHLALLAAFTAGVPAYEGSPDIPDYDLRAVVDLFGPTDFFSEARHFEESGYARATAPAEDAIGPADMLFGFPASQHPSLIRFINPIDCVHPGIPPVLLLHGRYDPMVPYQQSTDLYDRICSVAGSGRAEICISDDCTHADKKYEAEPYTSLIFDFLDKYMK